MFSLILKRAASRPSGVWKHEDYDVLADVTAMLVMLPLGALNAYGRRR